MRKNTASQKIGAQMVSATDGSNFTGSVTVYVTGDAGTQAAGSVGAGACTHEGKGYHTYAPAQAETNYNIVAFTFEGTGAVTATVQVETESFDVHDTVRMGLTALPNAAADAAGGLIISDAGGLDADAQRSDVAAILVDTGTTLDGRIPAALVGGRIDANVGAISGDSTAADNLESYTDGTTPQPVNATQWGGTAVASATVNANATQFSGDSTAADNAELFFDGTGYNASNSTIGTATTIGATGIAAIWSYLAASAAALATTTFGRYIYDKLALITSSTTLQVTGIATDGGTVTIYQGETINTATSNAVELLVLPATLNLTGYTPRFGITKVTANSGTAALEITGTVANAGATGQKVTFNLTSAQTAALALSTGGTHPFRVNPGSYYAYRFTISAFNATPHCPVLAQGWVDVKVKDTTCV